LEKTDKSYKYFKLPIDFDKLMEKEILPKCNLKESIAQYIHLIATSYLGECRFNVDFGCSLWEYDFDNSMTETTLRDNLISSLTFAISNNEKRLNNVEVAVKISQMEMTATSDAIRVKKKVDIDVNAKVIKTNETFKYYEFFFLGPLSYY
jgi:phage baseplate assembly protein W